MLSNFSSRNRYVLDTQPENQSDFSSRNRYILDTQAENRSQRAIREDVTLFTVSPAVSHLLLNSSSFSVLLHSKSFVKILDRTPIVRF